MSDNFELHSRDKKVQRMTRDGLVEENLTKGTESRISDRLLDADLEQHRETELDFSADRREAVTGEGKNPKLYQKHSAGKKMEPGKAAEQQSTQEPIAESTDATPIPSSREIVAGEATRKGGLAVAAVESQIGRGHVSGTAIEIPVDSVEGTKAGEASKTGSNAKEAKTGSAKTMKSRRMQKLEEKSQAVNEKLEQAQDALPKRKVVRHQRLFEEETGKVKHRLSFDDEVKPLGGSKLSSSGKAVGGKAVAAAGTVIHGKIHDAEQDNSAVEAAHKAELTAEGTVRTVNHKLEKHKAKPYQKVSKLEMKAEKANTRFLFEQAAEKQPELRKKGWKQLYQKHKIKKQYQAAYRSTKNGAAVDAAGKAVSSGTTKVKDVVISVIRKNKSVIVAVIAILLLLVLMISGLGSCTAIIGESGGGVVSSTYLSSDDEITSTDNQYTSLENALQNQLDNIESTYPGYDEYRYTVDEITHDPYALVSYLTAKYGNFTYAQVQSELQTLFESQYTLSVSETVEVRYRTETRTGHHTVHEPDGTTSTETYTYEVEVPYNYYILNITLTNKGLDSVVQPLMTEEQKGYYQTYQASLGNRSYLFGENIVAGNVAGGGISYEIPPEALEDADFRAMITEAEKYLGYPYVWGGSSPSTSFDCSGFVSWVINHSVGNVGRQTANGLMGCCTYVSPSDAKPGDLIFFQGTYNTSGASHVGIYVGNNMMIHCGNPIQYASIETNYWQQHFLCFGRIN